MRGVKIFPPPTPGWGKLGNVYLLNTGMQIMYFVIGIYLCRVVYGYVLCTSYVLTGHTLNSIGSVADPGRIRNTVIFLSQNFYKKCPYILQWKRKKKQG